MKRVNFLPPKGRHWEGFAIKLPHLALNLLKTFFQKGMSQHFGDPESVETDIDDIIVYADMEMKHDYRLNSVLD